MAKVLFTAIVADMRNKLNGSVFSKNRGGAYVRTKVTPVNAQTARQVAARSLLASLAQSFRSLTQEQINAWNSAVEGWQRTDIFGNSVKPTGLALYVRLNTNIINGEGTIITTPPAPVGAAALEGLSVGASVSGDACDIQFGPATVPADHALYVESTSMLSPGINNAKSRFRYIDVQGATATSPLDIFGVQTAKFGPLVEGQKMFVRAKFINILTGEVSQSLVAQCIVAA